MANYHVSKDDQSGLWRIRKEGGLKASASVKTQHEAELKAKHFASNSGGGEVRIHGMDGKIRDADTVKPKKDPRSSKDMKH